MEFLGFVLAFSAIHTSITYAMIRRWMVYANREHTTSRKPGDQMNE